MFHTSFLIQIRHGVTTFIVLWMITATLSQTLSGQCVAGNCRQGKGTYLFKDGSTYGGSFQNYLPEGFGNIKYKNGNSYSGFWHRGKKHGKGQMNFKNGNVYSGEFALDKMHGQGTMVFANGQKYEGQWSNNRAHGNGIWTFETGESYKGSFQTGYRHGNGIWTYTDGSQYSGNWQHNQKHGSGVLYLKNGQEKKQTHSNGKLIHEENSLNHSNRIQSENLVNCNSTFCHEVRGYYVYGDGSRFEGWFSQGEGSGHGICTYANGDTYSGEWFQHSPHGRGTMQTTNGSQYSGIWESGRLVREESLNVLVQDEEDISSDQPAIQSGKGKIYALIVGVAQYNHTKSLKYTDDDAYRLFAFLKSPEGGALADHQIKLLIDDAATKPTIVKELKEWAKKAGPQDIIFVYMSGHGLPGAFVPYDFDGKNNLLTYQDIFATLDNSNAKHRLFIADACHSGSMASRNTSDWEAPLDHFYQAFETSSGGSAFISSSKSEEVSLEHGGLRQGIFSHFLIRGLKGEANQNNDNLVTVDELFRFVSWQVKDYTAGAQNPSISGQYDPMMPVAMVMNR